ncbi:uncharacterized protein [Littorina saxatilis]|uniref:G-protein coupled receptors family 2 profile 2 domain-containing protein n=1 Tax=Littorina saxatilis TaxID=31220 RepID=A0AAN9AQN6_9CAEN
MTSQDTEEHVVIAKTQEEDLSGKQVGLWQTQGRVTVRVVLTITMDSTALLLVWAFCEIVIKRDRRRDGVLFILNLCYLSSLFLSFCFYNAALYIPPSSTACPAIVGLAHLTILSSLSWVMLTSLQRLLASRDMGPETVTSQWMATVIVVVYLFIGYGIPCISLVSLMTHFYKRTYTDKTMCWLNQDAIWWLILPVIVFTGGTFAVAIFAFGHFEETPADVKCHLYTCFLLSVMFAFCNLLLQVDLEWPADINGYLLIALVVTHNVIVWLHLTETLLELCPCAQVPRRVNRRVPRPAIQLVATADAAPPRNWTGEGDGSPTSTGSPGPGGLGVGQGSLQDGLNAALSARSLDPSIKSLCNFDDDMGASDEDGQLPDDSTDPANRSQGAEVAAANAAVSPGAVNPVVVESGKSPPTKAV